MPRRHPPTSPLSFLYLTMHCLGLFGQILLYQEVVLLAIVLRTRRSSDPGDAQAGTATRPHGNRLNRQQHARQSHLASTWHCRVTALGPGRSELDPQVQSAASIEAAARDDRPPDRGEQGQSCK